MTIDQKAALYLCIARLEGIVIAGYVFSKALAWLKAKLDAKIRALGLPCPPHDWDRDDRCRKCGAKDWMT